MPLGSTLALRASAFYRKDGGFIDSIGTAGSRVRENIDDSRSYGGRASLLFKPSPTFSLQLNGVLQNIEANAPTSVDADPATLATGYRTSKVVGSTVVNETNETVGKIDDLIITTGEKVPYAILSVGGFLGVGTKYVVVPASALEVNGKNMLLRGATKDSLKALPPYTYSN